MATCSFCQKPTTGPAGMKKVWANCGFCTNGYNRCNRCTWQGSVHLKCCAGYCTNGQVKCTQSGCTNGQRQVNQVCTKPHNQRA